MAAGGHRGAPLMVLWPLAGACGARRQAGAHVRDKAEGGRGRRKERGERKRKEKEKWKKGGEKEKKKKRGREREREREREIRSAAIAASTAAARARALVGRGAAVGGTRCAEQGKEMNETAIDSEI